MTPREQSYTERAAAAVLEAAHEEHDFGGWLASVLVSAAADLGSSRALTAGRPGSWEADLVIQLMCGTAGWNDEYLAAAGNPGDPMTDSARTSADQPGGNPQPAKE
jgi:hypothetical protein